MAKIIKQSLAHIDSAYLKALNDSDNEVISLVYKQVNHKALQKQISTGARYVAKLTGFGYHELKSLIQNRAITLMLNELSGAYNSPELKDLLTLVHHSGPLLDEDYAGQAIKFSIATVKSWAYSDKLKQIKAEHEMEFLSDHMPVVENSLTEQLDDIRLMGVETVIDLVANRKDSKEFLQYTITHTKEDVKAHFDLSETRYNQKVERALTLVKSNIDKKLPDYNYIMTMLNEMILTAREDAELSEDEQIEELYQDAVSGY